MKNNIFKLSGVLLCTTVLTSFLLNPMSYAEDKKEKKKSKINQVSETDKGVNIKNVSIKPAEMASVEAGNLYYDTKTKVLTATDKVDVKYQNRRLQAEKIVYDRNTKEITAETGVEFKSAEGTSFRASEIVTNDTFSKGVLKDVDGKLDDGSIFHAERVRILGARKYNLTNSYYSPCPVCDNKYLWKVRADKIVYDEGEGRVYYRDAYLDILDVPVGYTPYISHPTPFAQSKSGFLTPSFGRSSEYGNFLEIPYYYQPKSNLDFTFRPRYTTLDGPMLITEMRHLLYDGYYEMKVSGIYPEEQDEFGNPIVGHGQKFRGHIEGFGSYEFEDDWKAAFDAKRTTDDTFLRRYQLGFEDLLTSEARVERFKDKDRKFFVAKALSFQGLRQTDDPDKSPYVLPLIEAGKSYFIGGKYNQRIDTDLNTMVLKRSEGSESNRFIGNIDWNASHTSMGGHMFNVDLISRFDYYNVDEVPQPNGQIYQGSFLRAIPEASLSWEYPLINQFSDYSLIISPVVMGIVSPNGNNDSRIPNEDSQNIELYEYNLFQDNHISGFDIVESGTRFNYGLRSVISGMDFGDIGILFGQNYRIKEDRSVLSAQTGMSDNFSDYVGRFSIYNNEHFFTNYRFRMDKDNMKFKRNEAGFAVNYKPISFDTGYTFIDSLVTNGDRQEVYTNATFNVTDKWSVLSSARRNLDNDQSSGWVMMGGGVSYTHDCITGIFQVNRNFTRDRDVEPTTEFMFKINLANLGS